MLIFFSDEQYTEYSDHLTVFHYMEAVCQSNPQFVINILYMFRVGASDLSLASLVTSILSMVMVGNKVLFNHTYLFITNIFCVTSYLEF